MSFIGLSAVFLQIAFLAVTIPLAFARPEAGVSLGRRLGLKVTGLVKPWMAAPLCGLLAFAGSAAFALLVRFPVPQVHDEFSYLLAGNTFASGRLANQTPPFLEHFETFHVLQAPTYASKYPPGQGLLLALGELLGGHPIVGVWLGSALACALICWMLQAWVPFRWALLGGILASLNLGFFSAWSQSYWGGHAAAAGGALLLGGVRRLATDSRPSHGVAIAFGSVILAITRPFEGLLLCLSLGLVLGAWFLKLAVGPSPRSVLATCLVAAGVMAPFAAGLAHYNKAVTGSFSKMPYLEYEEQYGAVPVFLWAAATEPPDYPNEQFRKFQTEWAFPEYDLKRTLRGYLSRKPWETTVSLVQVLSFALLFPLMIMAFSRGSRWDRIALACAGLVVLALLGTTFPGSRKLAPVAGALMLLVVQGLRRLRLWRPGGRPVGRSIARSIALAVLFSTMLGFIPLGPATPPSMARARASLLHTLESTQERHLVFVKYSPEHNVHEEWVYNRANLEEAPVIWARDRTPEENRRLTEYFEGRRVWLLEADQSPLKLQKYEADTAGL